MPRCHHAAVIPRRSELPQTDWVLPQIPCASFLPSTQEEDALLKLKTRSEKQKKTVSADRAHIPLCPHVPATSPPCWAHHELGAAAPGASSGLLWATWRCRGLEDVCSGSRPGGGALGLAQAPARLRFWGAGPPWQPEEGWGKQLGVVPVPRGGGGGVGLGTGGSQGSCPTPAGVDSGHGVTRTWGAKGRGGVRAAARVPPCVPTRPRVALSEGTRSHGHQHPPVAHPWEQRPAGVADGGPHPCFTRTPSPSGAGQAHDGDMEPPLWLHKTRAVAWDMHMHILLLPLGGNPPTRPALIQLQLIGSCLRGFNFTGCKQNGFILPRVPMGTQGTAACRYGPGQGLTQKQHVWPQKEALWGQMVETPKISGSCSKLPGPVSAGVSLA